MGTKGWVEGGIDGGRSCGGPPEGMYSVGGLLPGDGGAVRPGEGGW